MALTSCPECKGQVSDQAAACPHCGAPRVAVALPAGAVAATPVKRRGATWEAVGTVMIVIGILAVAASHGVGIFLLVTGFVVFIIGRFL